MTLRFGTDGVRGVANTQLTPEFVLNLGRTAAQALGTPLCAVGRDPRRSGEMLFHALCAGLNSAGVTVVDLGIVPTPAVAHWAQLNNQSGAMISASHNPFSDNGVKFFAPGGRKLTDAQQVEIEDHLDALRVLSDDVGHRFSGAEVGTMRAQPDAREVYVNHLVHDITNGRTCEDLVVVLDAANGAASSFASEVFGGLGANVSVINAAPNGLNINDGCGSTHPESLQRAVAACNADVGLAFDGDADRVVAVDENGAVVDGDALLAIFALDLAARGALASNKIVATVMSNMGLRKALAPSGISVVECGVGDRHVLGALEANALNLGGEQSGHLIFSDHATTGDGMLAGVLLVDLLSRTSAKLSELASVVSPYPQILINVPLDQPIPDLTERIAPQITAAEKALGDEGRVLIRLSGTEPLARVMVEAHDADQAHHIADGLVQAVRASQSVPVERL